MRKLTLVVALATLFSTPLLAGMPTITLSVPGMTCATCPITVKKALIGVDGVTDVKVIYAACAAVVTFDDTRTSADALKKATANAGYPSTARAPLNNASMAEQPESQSTQGVIQRCPRN